LKFFGETGVVKLQTSTTPKIFDRGKTCILVGYSLDHAGDTYRMWDPDTKRVHVSRDIVWLNTLFFNKSKEWIDGPGILVQLKNGTDEQIEIEDESSSEFEGTETIDDIVDSTNIVAEQDEGDSQKITRSGRAVRLPARFREEFEGIMFNDQKYREIDKEVLEVIFVGAGIGEGIKHTGELHVLKYRDAMSGEDKEHWKKAIYDEHERMVTNKVWIPVKLESLTGNDKILTSTWAMKKKANGQFRARITARGFLQEDKIHFFSESTSAPVVSEKTIKTVLILTAMTGWKTQIIDVKGAFLKGRFVDGEKLYLKVPQGFEDFYKKDEVLFLQRTIYGLKQAALAFWRELLSAFTAMGFQRSTSDPCLYFKNTEKGLVI